MQCTCCEDWGTGRRGSAGNTDFWFSETRTLRFEGKTQTVYSIILSGSFWPLFADLLAFYTKTVAQNRTPNYSKYFCQGRVPSFRNSLPLRTPTIWKYAGSSAQKYPRIRSPPCGLACPSNLILEYFSLWCKLCSGSGNLILMIHTGGSSTLIFWGSN